MNTLSAMSSQDQNPSRKQLNSGKLGILPPGLGGDKRKNGLRKENHGNPRQLFAGRAVDSSGYGTDGAVNRFQAANSSGTWIIVTLPFFSSFFQRETLLLRCLSL